MNFQINKKEFLDNLNLASKAISSTTPLPALTGIKIIAEESNLVIISSDSNISIKTVLTNKENEILNIEEQGDIVIDARYLLEIVRKIDSENINFETIDGTLIKIYGGRSEYKINGMRGSEYPEINFETSAKPFVIDGSLFIKMIDQTSFACSDKDTRPILTGVNLNCVDGKLFVNATDSYRLATKTVEMNDIDSFNVTVPSKYINDICHSLGNEKEIKIAIDAQKISFYLNNSIIQTRLLDDAFPDTRKLIPESFTQVLVVNAREIKNAIDRSSFIKSDGKNIVRLTITSDEVDITSSNQIGSSYENLKPISFTGEPLEISCSGKYLLDALKALEGEEVTISFSGGLKPMIITSSVDENLVQLISPVRTYR